jgi:lactate dehydrogenase-like 2-hydroxyacid dehydrogenase
VPRYNEDQVSTFDVVMLAPMPTLIVEGIAAKCRLHKLWEAADRDAAVRRLAPDIRGIVAFGGHAPVRADLMKQFPHLEIVASLGVGYDQVDAAWAGEHGIVVTNTPDVLNEEVADTAFGLLLNAVRQLPQADAWLRAGKWTQKPYPLTASLRDRTMGIVGLGRIGKAIARRAEAFGLKVVYYGRRQQADVAYPYFADLVDMARASDILVVITPGGPETRHLVDAKVLEALGPQGVFVNVARGSVVDQAALIAALQQGKILTAGLDVFEDEPNVPREFVEMPHIALAPHVGSASHHTRDAMAQLVVDNIVSFAEGRGPLTPVAETPWPARQKQAT